jgi:transcriptional regulator with XRE-family HTH domain
MRERERVLARRRLDVEMRPYRRAGLTKKPTNGLLRAVRQALRVPVAEIAGKMGVSRSVVFELEEREPRNSITLRSMSRMAQAMGCKMVYGIVPAGGKTLGELSEERLWTSVLGEKLVSGSAGQQVGESASQLVDGQPVS